ncbi:MAG: thioesterase family protein [Anaerolineae bacterium]|nr:thioesterase family protein [Anaerolineae bacterium]
MEICSGLTAETNLVVQESDTARSSGDETLPPVLSTPRMVALMESTAHKAILPFLAEGQSSVGTVVNVRHLAATPVGMAVRVRAELLSVEGRRLKYRVEAWDAIEKIGEGEHERFIIDTQKFIQRLETKTGSRA